ncbi:MAG: MipA/OmpV family protein [Mariprofundus sp.]
MLFSTISWKKTGITATINMLSLLTFSALFSPFTVSAEESLPVWEVGIAGGGASLPQYMGSDERYNFAAPIPYMIYRGERLNIDRNGLRADLFGIGGLSVDASLGIGLPVKNDNRARAGMPALHFSLQAGPRINWRFLTSGQNQWTLRLPLRGVMDISGQYLGWVSEPEIQFEHKPSKDITLRLNTGLLYSSGKYNSHYYSVAAPYANATRSAYHAGAGLHSASVRGSVSWVISDRLRAFATLRYRNLSPGVVYNSPLVKTPHYLSTAFGLAWSFTNQMSAAIVTRKDSMAVA